MFTIYFIISCITQMKVKLQLQKMEVKGDVWGGNVLQYSMTSI